MPICGREMGQACSGLLRCCCFCCGRRGASNVKASENRKKGRRNSALMHNNMVKITQRADDQADADIEGQRLAAVLSKVRIAFDADSKEYNGIRKLLVEGMSVSNLDVRADALIAARQDNIDDDHKYHKERKKLLAKMKQDVSTLGEEREEREAEEKKKKSKKSKKKKKKHKHRQHENYTGKEGDYLDDLGIDARTAFNSND